MMENPTIVEPRRRVPGALSTAWYAAIARPMVGATVAGLVMVFSHTAQSFADDRRAAAIAFLVGLMFLPIHVITARNREDDSALAHLDHLAPSDRAEVLRATRRGEDAGDRLAPSVMTFVLVEAGRQRSSRVRRLQASAFVLVAAGVATALMWELSSSVRAALVVAALVGASVPAVLWLRTLERRDLNRARALRHAEARSELRRRSATVYGGKPIARTGSWDVTPLWSVVQNERQQATRA